MIMLRAIRQTHNRVSSLIPLLRKQKMLGKAGNPLDKGLWAKKYVDVIPLPEVMVTRYDSGK
jgi:hypothetical protein